MTTATDEADRPHFVGGVAAQCCYCGEIDVLRGDPSGRVDYLTGESLDLACASCLLGFDDREDDGPCPLCDCYHNGECA